jgi:hypothetical protein
MAIKRTNMLRYCPMCNTEIEASNFYQSMNPHHNGYLLYCKDHCDAINKEYKEKTEDQEAALWYTCAELGVPFVLDVYKKFVENKENKIETRTKEIDTKNGKLKYSSMDMMKFINDYKDFAFYYDLLKNKMSPGTNDWSTFYSGTDVSWQNVSKNIQDLDVKQSDIESYVLNWGKQDTPEDYKFLDNIFSKYTQGVEFVNSQQEDLYRDLCRDRLLLRKINDGRYKGDENIDKIQQRIARTMSILKVDQFEDNKPNTLSEQLIFNKIAQIEQTKPADLYKEPEKYKDFNKIRQYEKDMVLRPLLNTLLGHKDFDIDIDDVNRYNLDK